MAREKLRSVSSLAGVHIAAVAGFFLLAAIVAARAESNPPSYRQLPWHLVDIVWTLKEPVEREPFESLAIDLTISGDPGHEVRVFIAPMGLLEIDGVKAYAGLQSAIRMSPSAPPIRGIRFSRWDERRREFIRPTPEGGWQSSGHEGDFISAFSPLAWGAGAYIARLERREGSWVRFQVCLQATDGCTSAGELAFPRSELRLKRSFYSFVEIYGQPKPELDPARIPPMTITFGPVRVNDRMVRIQSARAHYPDKVPPYGIAEAVNDNVVLIRIGQNFDRERPPESRLGKYRQKLFAEP